MHNVGSLFINVEQLTVFAANETTNSVHRDALVSLGPSRDENLQSSLVAFRRRFCQCGHVLPVSETRHSSFKWKKTCTILAKKKKKKESFNFHTQGNLDWKLFRLKTGTNSEHFSGTAKSMIYDNLSSALSH